VGRPARPRVGRADYLTVAGRCRVTDMSNTEHDVTTSARRTQAGSLREAWHRALS